MRAFDAYSFHARVIPVLVVVLAPAVLLGAGIVTTARIGIALGVVLTVGSAIFSQLGRDRGKRLEPALWLSWGGAPTLQRLRWGGAGDQRALANLHAQIERILGEPLPSAEEELDHPEDADSRYRESTQRLIARTRDHDRFPLVFAENVNYGQRRNLLGLRGPGILVSATTGLAALLLILLAGGHLVQRVDRYGPALAAAVLLLLFWIVIVRPDWVRTAADAYASRLLESVELLDGD